MASTDHINDVEQLILLAIERLGDGAYGVPIRSEIEARTGRSVSVAAVYAALERLEGRRLLVAELSEPAPERGGRRRKICRLTRRGSEALVAAREALDRMWQGVRLSDRQSA